MKFFEAVNEQFILKQLRTQPIRKMPTAFEAGAQTQTPQAGGMQQRSTSPDKQRTTNYIRIQQRPVEDFKDGQFKTIEFGEKIKAVYGRVGGSGSGSGKNPGKWSIQTLLFPKDSYNIESATQWARSHGFKVGTGGVKPGNYMAEAGPTPGLQPQMPNPNMVPKQDGMPGYLGGPAPTQAQGTKGWKPEADAWRPNEPYVYNDLSRQWEPTEKAYKLDSTTVEKGLEVAIGGIAGTPGIFCDWCRQAIGAYKKYGDFRLCGKCYETTGRLRFEK